MKKLLLLIFISGFLHSFAQDKDLVINHLNSTKLNVDEFLGYDSYGFCYSMTNYVLSKSKKNESFEYKNISLGKPSKIDIKNPLKIMLFYENFNTIILLDNQLSETQKINFSENAIPIVVSATGIASENRLWIYNSLTQEIGLFDYLKNNYQSTTPSIQGGFKYYETTFNNFQWIDNDLNWYNCTLFGKITSLGKVPDFDQIQIISNQCVIFRKGNSLFIQDNSKNKLYPIEILEKSFTNFYYKDQILSIFTNQGISNYKIVTP